MNFLSDLVKLLVLAKLLGYPLKKQGIHPVVGHVVAGIILGPYILGLVKPSYELEVISSVALLLLLFYTGLTTDFRELRRRFKYIILMGVLGVVVTFSLVYSVLYPLGLTGVKALFIAIALSNTATETVAAALARIGGRDVKALIIGASFVDDIVAVFIISILSSLTLNVSTDINYIVVATILFITIVIGISQLLATKFKQFYERLSKDYLAFASASIVTAFLLALLAREAGLSELIGAYLAGILIGRGREFHDPMIRTRVILTEFIDDLSVVLEALFIPMFFTYVGLLLVPTGITPIMYLVLLGAAVLGKVLGCTPIAFLSLRNWRKSFASGMAMTGRGALETALMKLGLDYGLINQNEYSTIIIVALSTTIIAPLAFSLLYRED